MVNFKTIAIIFAVLTIIFVSSTGFLAATIGSSTHTSVQTVVQTSTVTITASQSSGSSASLSTASSGQQGSFAIALAYKPSLGTYLTNSTGWTVYLFTNDTRGGGKSSCYGECQTFWPPVQASASSLSLAMGLNASSFGTITRTDGSTQLTYQGWPLYYYALDKAAGQANGQGKDGTWFVLNVPKINIPATVTTTVASGSS